MNFKRTAVSVITAGALVAILAGCGSSGGGAAKTTGDVAKGKEIFEGTCAACHGSDARGITGMGKDLVVKSDWMKKQNQQTLIEFVKTGRPASDPLNTTKVDMPPKGGNPALSDDDLTNVTAYVMSIQK